MDLRASLIEAELDYAHFNALRTSASQNTDGISRATHEPFLCVFDSTKPDSSYFNRAVLAPSNREAIEIDFSQLSEGVRGVEVSPDQLVESMPQGLKDAGFMPGTKLCYLVAELGTEMPVEHRVERFIPDQVDDFFDLLELSGASFPSEKRALSGRYYCTDRFRCHVSYSSSGEPTGWATSFLCSDNESVFFANAFTLPEFRRQGFHSALMQARLNEVCNLGRKRAFTDVEPNTQSHQNAERMGFRLVTKTVIWERS